MVAAHTRQPAPSMSSTHAVTPAPGGHALRLGVGKLTVASTRLARVDSGALTRTHCEPRSLFHSADCDTDVATASADELRAAAR